MFKPMTEELRTIMRDQLAERRQALERSFEDLLLNFPDRGNDGLKLAIRQTSASLEVAWSLNTLALLLVEGWPEVRES